MNSSFGNKTKFRELSSTLLVDVQVTNVAPKFRTQLLRQTAPAPVDAGYSFNKVNVVVDKLGYQIPATKRLLFIETAYPISMLVGSSVTRIGTDQGGLYCLVGSSPACVLVAESEAVVNIVYY